MRPGALNAKGRAGAPIKNQIGSSSPAPQGPHSGAHEGVTARRTRPLTAHQLAVEANRNQRVNHILSRGLRKKHHAAKKVRKSEGAVYRALTRMRSKDDEFEDSEAEESLAKDPAPFRERGFRGLMQLESEEDDYGEEAAAYAAALRRTTRRLERWEAQQDGGLEVVGTKKQQQAQSDADESDDDKPPAADVAMADAEEDLDDMDKELLGLGSEAEEEEDLDDMDKTLLGLGGDDTEDESDGGNMEL